jgi:hypothetical protein
VCQTARVLPGSERLHNPFPVFPTDSREIGSIEPCKAGPFAYADIIAVRAISAHLRW